MKSEKNIFFTEKKNTPENCIHTRFLKTRIHCLPPTDADVNPSIECGLIIEAFLLCINCIRFKASFL